MNAMTGAFTSTTAIAARDLCKRFGAVQALDGLSLTLGRGEALGLIGTNGAGKTTALEILQGLRRPDRGDGAIFGQPLGALEARRMIGITPQAADFPEQLSPREVLAYAAAHYERPKPVDELIAAFGLERLIDRRMAGFSGGETRRVALALAFVGNPSLVFADEPTAGLDTDGQDMFRAYARSYVEAGGSLLLTSHQWDEIERICDRIVMIDRGRVILEGTLGEIRRRAGHCRISFDLPEGAAPPDGVAVDRCADGRWQIVSADSDALVHKLVAADAQITNLHIVPLDLKDTVARLHRERTQQ